MRAGYAKDIHCPFLDKTCMGKPCGKWDELIAASEQHQRSSYGRCGAVSWQKDRRSGTDMAKERIAAYKAGFSDGLTAYAYDKKGEMVIGNKGVTLNEAQINIEQIHNYSPKMGN